MSVIELDKIKIKFKEIPTVRLQPKNSTPYKFIIDVENAEKVQFFFNDKVLAEQQAGKANTFDLKFEDNEKLEIAVTIKGQEPVRLMSFLVGEYIGKQCGQD